MIGQLYINDKDAFTTWGVVLDEGSFAKLLTPAANKEYASNQKRSQHGKQVFRTMPRKEDRDVIITFAIAANSEDDFISKYEIFINEIDSGLILLRVPSLKKVFKLDAKSYQELSYYGYIGKIAVNFNEPNPKDRIQL